MANNNVTAVGKLGNSAAGGNRNEIFDGKKNAKLGTEKNPAAVTVQTEDRLKEVKAAFEKGGWNYKTELAPDKPEDITDLIRLQNPLKPRRVEKKVGRNEPCPCGSGKKYKNCCSE